MIWTDAEQVIAIHSKVIEYSGGDTGLRDRDGLEAAIGAPIQTFFGADLFDGDIPKIARLGFGLASNHAFVDGNKRIGALMTQLLLLWNGYRLLIGEFDLADTFIAIAAGRMGEEELLRWILKNLA